MKKNNMYYIKKCVPYFWCVRWKLFWFVVLSVIISLIYTFLPALAGYALDSVINTKLELAIILCLILLLITNLNSLFEVMLNKIYIRIQNSVCLNIKKDVINSFIDIKTEHINNESSGTFLSRINNDPILIFSAFNSARAAFTNILSNIFVIFYVSYLNIVLGIITLIGTILIYIIEKKAMLIYTNNRKTLSLEEEKNMGIINETVKGIRDIKLLNLDDFFKNKTYKDIEKVNNLNKKMEDKDMNYYFIRNFCMNVFSIIISILGIYLYKFNVITLATITIIFMYKSRLFSSIISLAWCEKQIREFSLVASRIFEIIDGKKYSKEAYGMLRIEELEGKIEFKNVSFSYKKEQIIKDMSFKIMPKDTIAIVGKSGSGKSTIINLIAKMFEIDKGKILLDGYNINDLDKYTLRKNIAVISQNPYIFNTTIKENLVMTNVDASQKQIENVCKICEIHDFIMTLPKKYNTLLGEGGINLSGGERQRLAIARALLKKSKILLFDEATSALDNETQTLVQTAINNISQDYTTIIVAHRLSTIKDCNKIMVIDGGKIIDIGNHKELIKRCKIYKTLYENELQYEK